MYKLIHFFSFHDRLKLVKSYSLTSRHQNVPKRLFFHPSVSANTKQPYLLICILNLIYLSFFLIQFSNCDVRINNHYRQSKGFTTDRRQFYCQPFLKGISSCNEFLSRLHTTRPALNHSFNVLSSMPIPR